MGTPHKKLDNHTEWIGGSRWAWATLVSASLFLGGLVCPQSRTNSLPYPNPARPGVGLQEYTADAVTPFVIGALLAGLPPPDPRQRKPPCVTRVGEEAINGFCWLKLSIRPPCPAEEHAHEHGNACYMAVLKAAGPPTSREGDAPLGVTSPTTP